MTEEENTTGADASSRMSSPRREGLWGAAVFVLGFAAALAFGWLVFPDLLFSRVAQPVSFSHSAHADSDCESCHNFRSDGSYTGIPKISTCRECHESVQGSSQAERALVEDYISRNREIPWKVYARQPDNVYFSHAPHKGGGLECVRCHRDVGREKDLPAYRENRITGYSHNTMKMAECEKCHAERGVSKSCEICHK